MYEDSVMFSTLKTECLILDSVLESCYRFFIVDASSLVLSYLSTLFTVMFPIAKPYFLPMLESHHFISLLFPSIRHLVHSDVPIHGSGSRKNRTFEHYYNARRANRLVWKTVHRNCDSPRGKIRSLPLWGDVMENDGISFRDVWVSGIKKYFASSKFCPGFLLQCLTDLWGSNLPRSMELFEMAQISPKLDEMQFQLLSAILIQALVPLILIYIPQPIMIIGGMCGVYLGQIGYLVVMSNVSSIRFPRFLVIHSLLSLCFVM
ncbi:Protein CBG04824 [Caenorhabditis briggsae]|uniref:Protein CBG04824 n=1 Tax=Caenorhabditis briggsae TaxID=6238 RepID=A8WYK1_CAEBR|nr:Protein CBG04824 [Caenorhabditis briggsae]CAP25459.2 Protein CBG04824 [Caenorhabditis briggsae]